MTKPKWDGDAFRRRMKHEADKGDQYADQHVRRLVHGQPLGKESIRDEYRGATQIMDHLAVSSETDDPVRLLRELDRLKEERQDYADGFEGDKSAFRKGFANVIKRVRKELKAYL